MARPRLSGTRWTYFVMRYRWDRQLSSLKSRIFSSEHEALSLLNVSRLKIPPPGPNEYFLLNGRLGCAIDAFLDTLDAWGNF
jgi:hypothetical protein